MKKTLFLLISALLFALLTNFSLPASATSTLPPSGYCFTSAWISINGSHDYANSPDATNQLNQYINITEKGSYYAVEAIGICWNDSAPFPPLSGTRSLAPFIQQGFAQGVIIYLNPYIGGSGGYDTVTLASIPAGSVPFLIALADECKSFGYPILIKFGDEPNINQGDGRPTWASDATAYVDAWRYVVSFFRTQGVTNVQWVWPLSSSDIGSNHWTAYYPGDAFVDWVDVHDYQYSQDSDPWTAIEGIYNDYSSVKPIMVGEYGVNWEGQNYSDVSRAAWLNGFFDMVEAHPAIKQIVYWFNDGWMFNSTSEPLTTSTFRNRIASSRYLASNPINTPEITETATLAMGIVITASVILIRRRQR
jgi:hypothetical protein